MLASDRPLLVGLMALEQNLVSADDLIDAFRAWRRQPAESLGHILAERGNLTSERLSTLERLVADSAAKVSAEDTIDWSPPTTTWRPGSTSVAGGDAATGSMTASPGSWRATFSAAENAGGRFRPVRLHAQGGLGRVYEAEDLELGRKVALKEIHPHAADDRWARHRFLTEAEITGRLEHPGVVPVYGLGADAAGRPFYAMRFIEGENLAAAIRRFHEGGPGRYSSLEFRQLLARVVGVCNAVGFAHSKAIIHRDLKPHNVMLGPFGETLVVDWGLAKMLAGGRTEPVASGPAAALPAEDSKWATAAGEIIGTLAYMSPEQLQGQSDSVGTASDVYGIGAILYVLLTGQSPGHGTSAMNLRNAKAIPIVPPRQIEPQVPRALAAICLKALEYEPQARYGSALDLAADIERYLADEPVSAYPAPWSDRAFRWMRKNRLPVAVALALVGVTVVATTIGYVLVRRERDIARDERAQAVIASARASANAAATREVVEQFLVRVADDRWSEIPGFEDVRFEMVNLAVARYRGLLAQYPDDLALGIDAAKAFRRGGNLYRMVGQFSEARQLHQQAVSKFRSLDAAGPDNLRLNLNLCEALCDLADLTLRESGPRDAEELYREAVRIGRQLREHPASSLEERQAEARAQCDLADVLRQLGRHEEAATRAQTAHDVLRKAAITRSRPLANQLADIYSAINLARILRELGRNREAAAVLREAERRLEGYLEFYPRDTNLRYLGAWGRLEMSLALAQDMDAADASEKELTVAILALGELVQKFPRTDSFRRKLAEALIAQAKQKRGRGTLDAAAERLQRAFSELRQADGDEPPPVVARPLLAAAHRLAGEMDLGRGDAASARENLEAARLHLKVAREGNPSEGLAGEAQEIEVLLQRVP